MAFWDWLTTAGSNASSDPGVNWQEGQLPSTVNDSARGMMAALAAWLQDAGGYAALGGTGNAFALTLSQTMQARKPGLIGFFATRTNVDSGGGNGAVTMKVDATAAAPLRAVSGADFTPGQIINGAFYIMSWNATTSEWLLHGKFAISAADLASITTRSLLGNMTGASAAPSSVLLTDLFASAEFKSAAMPYAPPGSIIDFAANAAPNGWLPCDGRAISRATYAGLFTNIGTAWGAGDGSATFAIPDFRGAFRRGVDNGRGLDANSPGRGFASYQGDANQTHAHGVYDPSHAHTVPIGDGGVGANGGGPYHFGSGNFSVTSQASVTGIAIYAAGSNEAVPRNYAVLPIIKT